MIKTVDENGDGKINYQVSQIIKFYYFTFFWVQGAMKICQIVIGKIDDLPKI